MTLIPNLSQKNPFHNLPSYIFKLHFHLTSLFMLRSSKRSLYLRFATRTPPPPMTFASAPQTALISFSVFLKSRNISENLKVWEFFYNLNISLSPCLMSRFGPQDPFGLFPPNNIWILPFHSVFLHMPSSSKFQNLHSVNVTLTTYSFMSVKTPKAWCCI